MTSAAYDAERKINEIWNSNYTHNDAEYVVSQKNNQ